MRRTLVVIAAIVLLFIVLAVVALKSLQSGAGRDRVARALATALGQPVEIGGLSVSVFPSPALTATQVRIGGVGQEAAPGIAVGELRVVPSLLSLIPGRTPTIERADLVRLVISIRRTASGQWLVPVPSAAGAPRPASGTGPAAGAAPGVVPAPTPAGATSAGTASAPPATRPSTPAGRPAASPLGAPAPVAIDVLRLRDGAVRLVDDHLRSATGAPTVTTISGITAGLRYLDGTLSVSEFEGRLGQTVVRGSAEAGRKGITLHLSSSSLHNEDLPAMLALAGMAPVPELSFGGQAPVEITTQVAPDLVTLTVSGQATVDQLTLGRLTLQSVHAPFRLERNVFTSDPLTFTAYGGHERGRVSVNLSATPPTFALRMALEQLDVNQALSATTTMKNVLLGTGRVSADVTGSGMSQAAIEKSLAGTVQFALENGDVRNLPVQASINRALGLTSGGAGDTKFQSLSGTAMIAGAQARTNDLALRAGDFSLIGTGTFGFDQSLDFHLEARLSAAKSAPLARIPFVKRLENSSGEIQLPVKVTGTVAAPMIGGINVGSINTKQLPGLLHQLLKK